MKNHLLQFAAFGAVLRAEPPPPPSRAGHGVQLSQVSRALMPMAGGVSEMQ